MADSELSVSIKLDDQLSVGFQNINKNTSSFTKGLTDAGKSLDDFHSNMRTAGRDLTQIGSQFSLLGAAISGPFALAFATWGKSSVEGAALMQEFSNTMDEVQNKLAQAVAPSFKELTAQINGMLDAFNKFSPAQQQAILQGVYMTGVFITAAGVFSLVTGKILEVAAAMAGLASKFVAFAAINPELAITYGAIALIVVAMTQWKPVADTVINTLQTGFNAINIIFRGLLTSIDLITTSFLKSFALMAGVLEKLPIGKQWHDALDGMRTDADKFSSETIKTLQGNVTSLNNSIAFLESSGQGSWAKMADSAKQSIDAIINGMKNAKAATDDESTSILNLYQRLTSTAAAEKQYQAMAIADIKQLATLQNTASNQNFLTFQNQIKGQEALLNEYVKENATAQQGMAQLQTNVAASLQTNMSAALTNIVTGAESAKQAFSDLGQAMIKTIVDFIAQKLVALAIENTILAGVTQSTAAAATVIAGSWAGAAAAAEIATLGGASIPANAGLITTSSLATSLFATPRAFGGDDIVNKPTLFLAGENGPERATFTPMMGRKGSGGSNGGINIYIMNPKMGSNQDVTQVAQQLGYKLNSLLRTGGGH